MIKRIILIIVVAIISVTTGFSQTPGMIFENLGIQVLDPNQDGFVSKTTGGFTTADKFTSQQSEIPYVPFAVVQSEPTSDPGPGPNCFFNDFDDIREYGEPMYSYYDNVTAGGPYMLYRYRLSGYAPNSKTYSVFIDIDGKFGQTGVNADLNYTSGNPGFEIEIYMASNFGVGIYNIDGLATSTLASDAANIDAKDGTYSYETNCQKSVAWPYPGGLCDVSGTEYFYDFYIPFSAISALTFTDVNTVANIGGAHITASTGLRMVGATVMNPNPGFGNNALSDYGGINDANYGNVEDLWQDMIDVFPPTSPDALDDGVRIAPKSDCPTIKTPTTGSTSITGNSTEDNGTNITVYVSANSDFSSSSTYTTTVTAGAWSVTVPALTLGHYVKATAQNPAELYGTVSINESTSYDNCDIEQVQGSCTDNKTTAPVAAEVVFISGSKGFDMKLNLGPGRPLGTLVYCYKADGTLADVSATGLNLKAPTTTNPFTTTVANQIFAFECQTGNCFKNYQENVYYFTFKEPGKCESDVLAKCDYALGTSTVPTITTASLNTLSTSISGTVTASATNSKIYVYAGVDKIGEVTFTDNVTPFQWTVTGLDLTTHLCKTITVKHAAPGTAPAGYCPTTSGNSLVVTDVASTPVITGTYCALASGSSLVFTGTSAEADGATVNIYKSTAPAVSIGSATVANNSWNITATVNGGDQIFAKITAASCKTAGLASANMPVSTSTVSTGLSIDATVETAVNITGVAPSAVGPYTIKIYVDGSNEYFNGTIMVAFNTATGIAASGAWSIAMPAGVIYPGAIIQASATSGANCESSVMASTEVTCDPTVVLKNKVATVLIPSVCSGTRGRIQVDNSQKGVFYQLYDTGTSTDVGLTAAGNGGTIYFQTPILSNPPTASKSYKIKAIRMTPSSVPCYSFLDFDGNGDDVFVVTVLVDLGPNDLTVTTTPSPVNICSGQTFVAHVASSQATISYQLFNALTNTAISSSITSVGENPLNITSNAVVGSGNIPIYVKAVSGVCVSILSQTKTVYLKESPTATASNNGPVCVGGTLSLTGGAAGAASYAWSGPNTYSNGTQSPTVSASATTAMAGTYTITVTGSNGCTSTATTSATVSAYPTITATTPGSTCGTGTVSLSATASAGTLNWYDASTLGNNIGSGSPVTTPSISSTTSYWVDATDNGCVSASRTEVVATYYSKPTASVLSGSATICNESSTNLVATITGGTSPYEIVINNGVGTISGYTSGTNISVSPSSSTTYSLTSVTDANNCPSAGISGTPTVSVNALPTATIGATTPVCEDDGTTITLTLTGTANWIVKYSDGTTTFTESGISSSPHTINVSPTSSVTYTITEVSDNNCTDTTP